MTTDMNLMSLKSGGMFAMSWLAGTNPKALRSKSQYDRIYSVNITKLCEEMIEYCKMKQNAPTFRILCRLCFGTIHIYSEQVKHLYNVTLNFVFAFKRCSRKRLMSSSVCDNSKNKRRRLESTDFIIQSLLHESEEPGKNVEDNFGFSKETKQRTSTCIQIKEITIRHVSWDIPMPDDEDAFGDASQEDINFLLSGFNGTADSFRRSQKRKASCSIPETSPFKRPCFLNESTDIIRYDPSTQNKTISEASLDLNYIKTESEKSITDLNNNDLTQTDLDSTYDATHFEDQQPNDQLSQNLLNYCPTIEESNEILLPDMAKDYPSKTDEHNVVGTPNEIQSPNSSIVLEAISRNSIFQERKRKRSQLIIDTQIKIPKTDFDNAWMHCYDMSKADHLASIQKPRTAIVFNKRIISSRVQSDKLLTCFNKNVKYGLQQNHDHNRQLILEEILGHEYETYTSLFNIKRANPVARTEDEQQQVEVGNEVSPRHFQIDENNNNSIKIEDEEVYTQSELNGHHNNELQSELPEYKSPLNVIDPQAISFDFPKEDEKDRSEWRKEEIMKKLLIAWKSENSNINMNSIIDGANRLKAATVFSTLLDLAGQNYIEMLKNDTNSIGSIKMGPKTILLMAKQNCP